MNPGGAAVKSPPANAGDVGLTPGSERSSRGGNGNPTPYSCLGNPMDRGAWQDTVHGDVESDTTEATEHSTGVNQAGQRWYSRARPLDLVCSRVWNIPELQQVQV